MDQKVDGSAASAPPPPRRICYLSRSRGWVDPDHPRRPASEVNLLAVALGSPVWTMGTAWESIFHRLIPLSVARAFRAAMVRSRLTEEEIQVLRDAAERLRVELVVQD